MKFGIVNASKDVLLTAALLTTIAAALQKQTENDLPTMWESTPCEVKFYSSAHEVPADANVFLIADNIPEAPGALAYHTVNTHGRPMLKLGWETIKRNGGTINTGANSMSAAMSHEVLETIGDPYCSFYAVWLDGIRMVSLELCDPVEGDSYDITIGDVAIAVSNFVGPRWFDVRGSGPYDFMNNVGKPLTLTPGGYVAFSDGTQMFAEAVHALSTPEARGWAQAKTISKISSSRRNPGPLVTE